MKKILHSLALLLLSPATIAAALANLDPAQLASLQTQGALVVDVRTPEEWSKTGLIPGSKGLTYFDANGGYDKAVWLKQLQPWHGKPDQPVVLVCRSGHRSAEVGKMLAAESGFPKVYHLQNGIKGWAAEGRPLVPASP